jgi:hypothetical protein
LFYFALKFDLAELYIGSSRDGGGNGPMKPRQPFGISKNGANSCGKDRKMGE